MTRKQKTNPEWEKMKAARRARMESQGFPEGVRVKATTDAHPNIPEFCRYHTGTEGTVILNMATRDEDGFISVRFDGLSTSHACYPQNLERM